MEPLHGTQQPASSPPPVPASWTTTRSFELVAKVVEGVAVEAGVLIMDALATSHQHVHLKSHVDLVTDTDRKVEAFIISALATHFPSSKFLAEEEASSADPSKGGALLSHEPTWIIDPIDDQRPLGTTNFVHKYPIFCVSIALAIEGQVVVGVVYNPQLRELFTATKCKGAFLNGLPIRVAQAKSLDKAVIATNVGIDRTPEGAEFLTRNLRTLLLNNVQSLRSGGSAAWEMSSVACGRLDAFYERGIHEWDIAAGLTGLTNILNSASLIVTEAGGVVRGLDGGSAAVDDLRAFNGQVLCGNQQLVNIISSVLFSSSSSSSSSCSCSHSFTY